MIDAIKKFQKMLIREEYKKFIIIFVMMIIAAIFETLSISVILPIINLLMSPDIINESGLLSDCYNFFNFSSFRVFGLTLIGLVLLVFIVKAIFMYAYKKYQLKVIYNVEVRLMIEMLEKYTNKEYELFLNKNTSEFLRVIYTDIAKVITKFAIPLLQMTTEILVFIALILYLFFVQPAITLVLLIAILLLGVTYIKVISSRVRKAGDDKVEKSTTIIKWVSQTISAIKEIKIYNKKDYFVNELKNESIGFTNANKVHKIFLYLPQLLIEFLFAIGILTVLFFVLWNDIDIVELLPTFTAFAMVMFRISPSINRIIGYTTNIKGAIPFLEGVYNNYCNSDGENLYDSTNDERLHDVNEISLKGVSFAYEASEDSIFDDFDFSINKNDMIGIIGTSGAGKTTLIYLLMGLLKPTVGTLSVNDIVVDNSNMTQFRDMIGFIPQDIYLLDDSLKSNIAFGCDSIDEDRVNECINTAQLNEFVLNLESGIDSNISENGLNISGGQKQRVGIARALYNKPSVLIMDEGTSALDNKTETTIMKLINEMKGTKTMIIIAHRTSTLKNCNKIYDLNKKRYLNDDEKRALFL